MLTWVSSGFRAVVFFIASKCLRTFEFLRNIQTTVAGNNKNNNKFIRSFALCNSRIMKVKRRKNVQELERLGFSVLNSGQNCGNKVTVYCLGKLKPYLTFFAFLMQLHRSSTSTITATTNATCPLIAICEKQYSFYFD